MSRQRIGILGGTFDPVHFGHILPAQYAFNHLGLGRLIFVPSGAPVHRPRHTPAPPADRLAMCRLAVAPLPRFEASDVETARTEPSYTVLTVEHFSRAFGPDADLFLLIGEDNLPLLHTWHRVREVLAMCSVVPMPRPGGSTRGLDDLREAVGEAAVREMRARRVPGPLVPISGTQVRRLVSEGKPVRGLVPEAVADYIAERRLYRRTDR